MKDLTITLSKDYVLKFLSDLILDMGVDLDEFSADSTLEDLGLDSLDVVELAQGVKKKLKVPVAPGDFADAETLREAVDLVLQKADA